MRKGKLEAVYLIVNSVALLALAVYLGALALGGKLPEAALPLLILIEAANVAIAVYRIYYNRKRDHRDAADE